MHVASLRASSRLWPYTHLSRIDVLNHRLEASELDGAGHARGSYQRVRRTPRRTNGHHSALGSAGRVRRAAVGV